MPTGYKGKKLSQTVVVPDLLNGESVVTMQAPFLLNEADFLRLQSRPSVTSALATILFSGVVSYAVTLGPKIIPLFSGEKLQLTRSEMLTLLIGTVAAVGLYGSGFLWLSQKKKVMKRISQHFTDAKPSSHIIGRRN